MSFPRYPSYKPSGVEWLGEVPAHWRVKKFRYLFRESSEKIEQEVIGPMLSVSGYRGIEVKEYDDDNRRRLDEDLVGYRIVRVGQLVVNTMWLNYAGLGVSAHEGHVSPAYRSYWIEAELERRYVHHLLRSGIYVLAYTRLLTGVRPNSLQMSREDLMNFPVVVPPPEDQTRIAEFLDRETAKIDGLVAEQRRLMELLKEKRQAVISHAVTRGLNPKAPLKPSGIEWLGDVPAHWDVMKGSLIGTLFGSEQIPEELVCDEGDLPFIKVGSMSSDSFAIESWDWFVDRSIEGRYSPRSGFIVFPKRGAAIFLNKVNIVDRPSLIDPNLMGWAIGDRDSALFIAYALKSRKLDELADVSTVPQINNKHIGPERFPVPPLKEQLEIVVFLASETAKLDALTAEAQRAIDLLQERRTALISAAVTGQIDVRGLAADAATDELLHAAESAGTYATKPS